MGHLEIDVLLICALKEEYDQALTVSDGLMPPGWKEYPDSNGWIVADGRFKTVSGNPLSIRASYADHMGRESVQAVASKLLHTQPARCIAMSGICAGWRDKLNLGDVIFADRSWSYDAGKLTIENGEQQFKPDTFQYRPSPVFAQRMQHFTLPSDCDWLKHRPLPFETQEDWVLLRVLAGEKPIDHPDFNTACPDWGKVLERLWQRRWLEKPLVLTASGKQRAEELTLLNPHKLPDPSPFQIHVAPMATGAAVTEDAGIFPRLAESMRKVLGVEMEASALGALGEIHDLPVVVAKGVSDYGDAFKNDRYRTFAARAAAECLIGFLRESVDLLPGRKARGSTATKIPHSVFQKPTKDESNGDFPWLEPNRIQQETIIEIPTLMPAPEAIMQAFGAASEQLLSWPQLTKGATGDWIERPELERMLSFIYSPPEDNRVQRNIIALLGAPGCGKSALLARMGEQLQNTGVFLLAIKADMLPNSVDKIDDLVLGTPAPLMNCLRSLSIQGKTVLLLDQLDALCELMDQHTSRLRVLLALLNHARNLPNLKIVVSCRAFEYEHDARLNTLKAEELELRELPWSQIQPILQANGLSTTNWPEAIQKILCTPQHLNLYLRHLADSDEAESYQTYQDMLARVLDKRIIKHYGQNTLAAAIDIAAAMAEEEELWLDKALWIGSARFEKSYPNEIENLVEAGIIIRKDARRIGFCHQTWYEYLRGRGFVENGGGLAEFVLARQDALFVRPTLWCAMHYLRVDNPLAYRKEFSRLWNDASLRIHVRLLLAEFLAGLSNPDDTEAGWLLPTLNNPVLRTHALRSMQGNTGWFRRLKAQHLPKLMTSSEQTAWESCGILRTALRTYKEEVLRLIERYWTDSRWAGNMFRVLEESEAWDERILRLLEPQLKEINTYLIGMVALKISNKNPNIASRLVADKLWQELEQVKANLPEQPEPAGQNDNLLVWQMKSNRASYEPFNKLLTSREIWQGLDKLAKEIPTEFLSAIWPWLLEVFEAVAVGKSRDEYRRSASYEDVMDTDRHLPYDSARKALVAMATGWAKTQPESFMDFVRKNQTSDLLAVHFMLAWGLAECTNNYPKAVAEYLIGDKRRLTIGGHSDRHNMSKTLINKIMPHLDNLWRRRIERFILAYKHWDDYFDENVRRRFDRSKWNREHLFLLLQQIPKSCQSQHVIKLIEQEERALGPVSDYGFSIHTKWSKSPISDEQMLKASDQQILRLFDLIANKQRRYCREHDGWKLIEASRAFAKFAEAKPERALSIIQQLKPESHDMPAGYALAELGKTPLSSDQLLACIVELNHKGFHADDFRHGAASCIESLAWNQDGFDETVCAMLESWLKDCDTSSISDNESPKDGQRLSIIWQKFGMRIVPGGNVPVLQALTACLLRRNPVDADGWLGVLERHIDRQEQDEVWGYLAAYGYFDYLCHANPDRAIAFIYRLVNQRPQLINSHDGAYLMARSHRWLPVEFTYQILDGWLKSDWPLGRQAVGELMLLRHVLFPEDAEISRRCESALAQTSACGDLIEIRLGMAYTAAELWNQQEWRSVVAPILERLLPLADAAIADAILSVFWGGEEFVFDEATERLFNLLADNPTLLQKRDRQLVDRLKEGLLDGCLPHDLILRVASALAVKNALDSGNPQADWAAHSGELVDIALTLQRTPNTRSAATTLFEQLMEKGDYTIEGALKRLDCRM